MVLETLRLMCVRLEPYRDSGTVLDADGVSALITMLQLYEIEYRLLALRALGADPADIPTDTNIISIKPYLEGRNHA
ncbi:hypothetical protein HB780_05600 (plasmid) [Rhizobium lusitanum]|uniref:hypothetical protein n=1 Tax=Rhizobium lusitanum TaxID=293958 RepID=UPI00161206D0|nr:hypothetical protein [Rhizobium lusitanum]QND45230.1 hypothetical protein HB780_05600 [Rhizobium lusitanum]